METLYIKTSASKPPEKAGWYMCYNNLSEFAGLDYYSDGKFDHEYVAHWLKPITQEELAVEFAEWCADGEWQKSHGKKYWLNRCDARYVSTSELFKLFLEEKTKQG